MISCRLFGLSRFAVVAALALAVPAVAVAPAAAAPFVGGSWEIAYHAFDPRAINAVLPADLPPLPQYMLSFGGGGSGPLPASAGQWTIGGFGAGGQAEEALGAKRSRLAVGYGGVRVGYSAPVTEQVSFEAGLGAALGGATLILIRTVPSGADNLTGEEVTLNRFMVALIPDVGVSMRLGSVAYVQASVGYFWDTGIGAWKNAIGDTLNPQPELRLSGIRASLALSFGPGWEVLQESTPAEGM